MVRRSGEEVVSLLSPWDLLSGGVELALGEHRAHAEGPWFEFACA